MDSTTTRPKRSLGTWMRAVGRARQRTRADMEATMPLLAHLEELRKRLFVALGALAATTLLSFAFAQPIMQFLATPVGGLKGLTSIEVTENIGAFMRVSLLSGVALGMPVVVYELLAFVLPGLKENEKRWVFLLVPAATVLFLAGAAFAWFVMLPVALPFLTQFMGIQTQVRPSNYFGFLTQIMFWLGICFELPLILMMLAKLHVVSSKQLLQGWRYAVVGAAVIAAVVTPTVDPVNMSIVMAPLLLLYAVSILLARMVGN